MKKFTKTIAFSLAILILLSSCTSTTLISSTPSNAKLYVNGEYKGETPHSYADKKVVFSSNTVLLKKEGYEDIHTTFSRDEKLHVGALIGGIFFYFPFLWVLGYNPQHHYNLSKEAIKESEVSVVLENKDKIERLKEWKNLYDEGAITEEEYEKQKSKILED